MVVGADERFGRRRPQRSVILRLRVLLKYPPWGGGMRRGTLTLLLLLVPVLPACGKLKCEDVAIDTPTDTFRTESASPGSFPRAIRGPVDQVLCCVGSHCANPPSCACGVDCTQPPLRD